ncbi:hypothetical protein ABBQ32_002456 [Trebouxia sp. C0010 RCD-2024]
MQGTKTTNISDEVPLPDTYSSKPTTHGRSRQIAVSRISNLYACFDSKTPSLHTKQPCVHDRLTLQYCLALLREFRGHLHVVIRFKASPLWHEIPFAHHDTHAECQAL